MFIDSNLQSVTVLAMKMIQSETVMFSLRSSCYDLRGNNILSLCKPRTTSFGLSSVSYFGAKQWNALPDCIRTSDFTEFKRNIQGMTFV